MQKLLNRIVPDKPETSLSSKENTFIYSAKFANRFTLTFVKLYLYFQHLLTFLKVMRRDAVQDHSLRAQHRA